MYLRIVARLLLYSYQPVDRAPLVYHPEQSHSWLVLFHQQRNRLVISTSQLGDEVPIPFDCRCRAFFCKCSWNAFLPTPSHWQSLATWRSWPWFNFRLEILAEPFIGTTASDFSKAAPSSRAVAETWLPLFEEYPWNIFKWTPTSWLVKVHPWRRHRITLHAGRYSRKVGSDGNDILAIFWLVK